MKTVTGKLALQTLERRMNGKVTIFSIHRIRLKYEERYFIDGAFSKTFDMFENHWTADSLECYKEVR